MFFVYVLKSKKDSNLYVGHTNDIKERFSRHNSGEVRSTRSRRPFEIVYTESFDTRAKARWRERFFKTAWGKKTLFKLIEKKVVPQ